ncbi:sphinganine kinase LCB4 NDAI_0K02870 [Naumovozyma dairenensis CBS 421]|uniref:sphingosine kinase n=1 Tax=Naumovozyma dairenensis (strain ATCC 10597 / BCRC 20456 / CBS 421 / NBRC 0211 / NRRL Y-12639) TaxID=1071378 RepID=G0WI67_NAUDC|nr:hypothetical protein NDAI_0K02870 [Naumovozyma dairenensis CBS 421]CCD27478.1 hypothetical protein NDAI_0K02870 [Naumovozyma dairenensis CBS 421]
MLESASEREEAHQGLLSLNLRPTSRALLTSDGILLKSQNNSCYPISHATAMASEQQYNGTDPDQTILESKLDPNNILSRANDTMDNPDSNHSTSVLSLLSCISCIDSPTDSHGSLLPINTTIPYARILNAKYIGPSEAKTNNNDTYRLGYQGQSSLSSSSLSPDPKQQQKTTTKDVQPDNPFSNEETLSVSSVILKSQNSSMQFLTDNQYMIELSFVIPIEENLIPKKINLIIDYLPSFPSSNDLVQEIMNRSYKNVSQQRSILIIINPHGGKGKASKLFNKWSKPILSTSNCKFEIINTTYSSHATDIAKSLDISKYDIIACASGDGIPYEVINGLYQRPDRVDAFNKLTITQIPCGSGNAMSISCHWTDNTSHATLCLLKSIEKRIDLMCCSQPSYANQSPRLSFLSQTFGVIAESDINTEFIRWMGPVRFELGVAYNVIQGKRYPCDIFVKYATKSKDELKSHYIKHKLKNNCENEELHFDRNNKSQASLRSLDKQVASSSSSPFNDTEHIVTEQDFIVKYPLDKGVPDDWEKLNPQITDNLNIFYTGKMPYISADTKFFPAALPNDGTFDLIITDISTPLTKITPILLSLDKGAHVLHPEVIHSKIIAYKMIPKIKDSVISVDGERFPVEPIQVEIMPNLCKTLLRNGSYVDSKFDLM